MRFGQTCAETCQPKPPPMTDERPSDTAVLIARSICLAEAAPSLRALVPEESAALSRHLLAVASPPGWFEFCLPRPWARRLLLGVERVLLPGIFLHYLVRKKRIAALVADARRQGCAQLVVLGAGLDTLAWRESRRSSSPCFELDHPATQAIKRRAFREQDADLHTPRLVPLDLTVDSPTAHLRATPGFTPDHPTVFVAEGLLMYLAPERVDALLRELAALAAPESRLVLTFMETRPGRPLAFHNARALVSVWLRVRREPFRWGLARAESATWFEVRGWRLAYLSSPASLRASLLAPLGLENAPLALGESIALLERLPSPAA